jgi:hypothetical protein
VEEVVDHLALLLRLAVLVVVGLILELLLEALVHQVKDLLEAMGRTLLVVVAVDHLLLVKQLQHRVELAALVHYHQLQEHRLDMLVVVAEVLIKQIWVVLVLTAVELEQGQIHLIQVQQELRTQVVEAGEEEIVAQRQVKLAALE